MKRVRKGSHEFIIMRNNILWINLKLSPVGGDTNRGNTPWAVSPLPTFKLAFRQLWRYFILSFIFLLAIGGTQKSFAQIKYTPVYKTYRVAIIAPLYLDSVFTGYHLKSENSIPKYTIGGADFVQGAELALDTINLHGNHVEAFIYDSKSIAQPITELIKSGKLDHINLIIGSVKQPEYYQLTQFAFQKNIPFISATYPNDGGIRNNPDLLIANSTLKAHCEGIFSYILQQHGADNIYLIHKKNENRISNYFKDINIVDGKPLLKIKEIMLDSSVSPTGLRYLVDTSKPVVIIGASLNQLCSKTCRCLLSHCKK
jgi:hypothetical protein